LWSLGPHSDQTMVKNRLKKSKGICALWEVKGKMYGTIKIYTNDDDKVDYQSIAGVSGGSIFESHERLGEVIITIDFRSKKDFHEKLDNLEHLMERYVK
jgi:hypothetical protein